MKLSQLQYLLEKLIFFLKLCHSLPNAKEIEALFEDRQGHTEADFAATRVTKLMDLYIDRNKGKVR